MAACHPISPADLVRVMARNVAAQEAREAERQEAASRAAAVLAMKRKANTVAAVNRLLRKATQMPVRIYAAEVRANYPGQEAESQLPALSDVCTLVCILFGELYDVITFQEKRAYDARGQGYTHGVVIYTKGAAPVASEESGLSSEEESSSSSEEEERPPPPPAKRLRPARAF